MMMIVSIGQWVGGIVGALAVVAAFFGPTALLALCAGRLWKRLEAWPWRASIQQGLAPVSIGLLLAGCFTLAKGADHDLTTGTIRGFDAQPVKIREVLFIDTEVFRLYNNAFILRRRIPYKDGLPIGDAEIVFKFRHPDLQVAAETDVRPNILGGQQVKFKCQALPLKDQLGGIRLLYSHNVQFLRSSIGMGRENVRDMDALVDLPPVLGRVKKTPKEEIRLVSNTIVEEVLQDIGVLDFGQGITGKANVSICRTRGEHRPLIGEFAFQFRFQDRALLGKEALKRAEALYIALQYSAEEYIALNATKTATVYRLLGNPPRAHE